MSSQTIRVRIPESLRFLLPIRQRDGDVTIPVEADSTVGHLVESLGVPRTEIGELRVDGRTVEWRAKPGDGREIEVVEVSRPQRHGTTRFLLDVHLGTLARRMRLLGIDTAYSNDAADPALVVQAIAEDRILLTQDRGLLRRKALPAGGYVRGSEPDDQLRDVLNRYDPPLAPWSRCPSCNGLLEQAAKEEIEHLLEEGTRRSYSEFSRCASCGRPYWRGAHADQLAAIVAEASGRIL